MLFSDVISVSRPCSAMVGEKRQPGLPSFMGSEGLLGTDGSHRGGELTLSCPPVKTCCFLCCWSPGCAAGRVVALGLVSFSNAPAPHQAWGLLRGPEPVYPDFSSLGLSLMGHRSLPLSGPLDLAACSVITFVPGDGVGLRKACDFKDSWCPCDSSPEAQPRGLCWGLRGD